MKIAQWSLVILLAAPLAGAASPQQGSSPDQSAGANQQDPLAAAARRAQEQKKDQPKASKVWDNDNIPNVTGNINVVGQSGQSASSAPSAAPSAPAQNPSAPITPERKAALDSDLSAAKAELESLKTDLDIAQRKYGLDEQSYLSNPNHDQDKSGAAALQDEKDDIAAKQQAIADAQKKIDDLQAQVNAAGNSNSQ